MARSTAKITVSGLLALLLLFVSGKTFGQTINTAEILSKSVSLDCLNWRISGICLWLKCSFFGCYVVASPKIAHRIPDFVVSAYPQTGNPPWTEIRAIFSALDKSVNSLLSGGSISGVTNDLTHQDVLQFNEVDIIGNPVVKLNQYSKFLCRSEAEPLMPYYLSILDAPAWRSGLPDALRSEAMIPGQREVGEWPKFTWGSIFPRSGFIHQQHAGKAAAVASQRAIDVLLNDGEGHIHQNIFKSGKKRVVRGYIKARTRHSCQVSGGRWEVLPKFNDRGKCVSQTWQQWVSKSNEKTDRWQMLLPNPSRKCGIFGSGEEWPYRKLAENGSYIWNYWRNYKCCVKAGHKLLHEFNFE